MHAYTCTRAHLAEQACVLLQEACQADLQLPWVHVLRAQGVLGVGGGACRWAACQCSLLACSLHMTRIAVEPSTPCINPDGALTPFPRGLTLASCLP